MKAAFGGDWVQVLFLPPGCPVVINIITHYSFATEYLHCLWGRDTYKQELAKKKKSAEAMKKKSVYLRRGRGG